MASGSGLASALAVVKAHAVAATVIGALVVGGGGAAAAVATGAVQVPGVSGHQTGSSNETTQRAQACANNGDASRLAAIYAPMFSGSTSDAQTEICKLFSGSGGGHAQGLGQVQLVLEITAAIERPGGSSACLTTSATHGQPTETGKPANPGSEGSAGAPAAGQPDTTIPSASTADTNKTIDEVIKADPHGTSLAQLARNCGATPTPGNPGGGTDTGQPETTPDGKPSETPGAKPTGTPGARPTGTPGDGHP